MSAEWPAKLRDVVDVCMARQRAFVVNPGIDTGGSPYVTLTTKWGDGNEIRLTWHTRGNNGRYRFFSGLASTDNHRGWHDVTVKRALELIEAAA